VELTISVSEDVRHILEQRAKAYGQDVKSFVESLVQATATQSVDELPVPTPASDAEFESDMQAFAEGTEHLPAYSGTYSRADIYLDHD
jgi:uncharacterized protein (DUF1778 family)